MTFPVPQRENTDAGPSQPDQRSNGARNRSNSQSRVEPNIPEDSNPQGLPLVVSSRPNTATTPCRRPPRKRKTNYADANLTLKQADEQVKTPVPVIKYVDNGVSPMGNKNLDQCPATANAEEAAKHPQLPVMVPTYNGQPNLYGHYYNIFPMARTPSYVPGYCTDGRFGPITLWPQPVMSAHETSLQVNPTRLPDSFTEYHEQLDYEQAQELNYRSEYIKHRPETHPGIGNDADGFSAFNTSQGGHELLESVYKSDEEAREFWRPNFLR